MHSEFLVALACSPRHEPIGRIVCAHRPTISRTHGLRETGGAAEPMIRRGSIERKEEEKRRCIEARKLRRKIEEKGRGAPKGREGEEKRERGTRGEKEDVKTPSRGV